MLNKGPQVIQTDNLPPWQWKREKAPRYHDPGGAPKIAINTTDPAPLLQDGQEAEVVQVHAVESSKTSLGPASQGEIVPQTETDVKEDGK